MKFKSLLKDLAHHLGYDDVIVEQYMHTVFGEVAMTSSIGKKHCKLSFKHAGLSCGEVELLYIFISSNTPDDALELVEESCMNGTYDTICFTSDDGMRHSIYIMHDAPYESVMMQADLLNACA